MAIFLTDLVASINRSRTDYYS